MNSGGCFVPKGMPHRWILHEGRWVKLEPGLLRVPLHWPTHPSIDKDLDKQRMRDFVWRPWRHSWRGVAEEAIRQADRLDAMWGLPTPQPVPKTAPLVRSVLHLGSSSVHVTSLRRGRLLMHLPVDETIMAHTGRGDAGHLILDRFVKSSGVPEDAIGTILELVHKRRGLIRDGLAELLWQGHRFERGLKLLAQVHEAIGTGALPDVLPTRPRQAA